MPFPISIPDPETLDEQLDTFPRLVDSGVSVRAPDVKFPYYIAPHLLAHRVLGEGGTAVVFEALHTRLKVRVAVKVLKVSGPGAAEARERMQREAELCARIDNPRIPRIFDVDTLRDGTPYVVMEEVHGRPLDQVMAHGPLDIDLACEIICEVLEAIGELHSAGIVHRDVKPSNLILEDNATQTLRVRVLDLGIAKPLAPDPLDKSSPSLTLSGTLLGTPHYMASEQLVGGEVDGRTDLYAVGVMFYECLAGRPPFDGDTAGQVIAAAMRHEVTPIEHLRSDVPEGLQKIVERAMQQDADLRYPSTAAMFDEVRAFQASQLALPGSHAALLSPSLVPSVVQVTPPKGAHVQRSENALWATRALDSFPPSSPGRRPLRPRAWFIGALALIGAGIAMAWPATLAEPHVPAAAVTGGSAPVVTAPAPLRALTEPPREPSTERGSEQASAVDLFYAVDDEPSVVEVVRPTAPSDRISRRRSSQRRSRDPGGGIVPPVGRPLTPYLERLDESLRFTPEPEQGLGDLPRNPYLNE